MLAKLAEMLLAFSINSLCIYANNCDIVSDPKTKKHYQDNLLEKLEQLGIIWNYVNKKSVLIFSQFVTNIGKLIVVSFIINKEPTVYRY